MSQSSDSKGDGSHAAHRILWPLMCGYSLFFIWFAWQDLYSEHTTQGLFEKHYSPYTHELGYVIDPKPNTTISTELQRRLKVDVLPEIKTVEDAAAQLSRFVKQKQIRPPNSEEILLGSNGQDLLLVVNTYLGQVVTYRPSIGIVLEDGPLESIVTSGLMLKVPIR